MDKILRQNQLLQRVKVEIIANNFSVKNIFGRDCGGRAEDFVLIWLFHAAEDSDHGRLMEDRYISVKRNEEGSLRGIFLPSGCCLAR